MTLRRGKDPSADMSHVLRSSRTALAATLLCAAGLVATVLAVRFLAPLQARDVLAFGSFRRLDGPSSSGPLRLIASVGDPLLYVVLGLTAAAVAYARGRERIAIAIPLLLLTTGITTQVLKVVLDQGTLKPGSFPSGHATAALTLALCAALAAPPRLRPTVIAAGAGLAAAVSYAIVSLGWHSPSDILGGFLVAATLTGIAGVVLLRGEERRGETPPPRPSAAPGNLVAPALAGVAGIAAVAVFTSQRGAGLAAGVQAHTTATAAAASIAALAATLLVVFARIAR
jgi:membrane-associated phospholipid phosphatase